MKSIKDLHSLQQQILFNIVQDPEEATAKFEKEWKVLSRDDKNDLRPILLISLNDNINSKDAGHPQGPKNLSLQKIAASRIKNRLEKELDGKIILPKMKLADGVELKDVAAAFRMLFKIRYFKGKLKDFEAFAHNLIEIPDTKTFHSYMKDDDQILKHLTAFKKRISEIIS